MRQTSLRQALGVVVVVLPVATTVAVQVVQVVQGMERYQLQNEQKWAVGTSDVMGGARVDTLMMR